MWVVGTWMSVHYFIDFSVFEIYHMKIKMFKIKIAVYFSIEVAL